MLEKKILTGPVAELESPAKQDGINSHMTDEKLLPDKKASSTERVSQLFHDRMAKSSRA